MYKSKIIYKPYYKILKEICFNILFPKCMCMNTVNVFIRTEEKNIASKYKYYSGLHTNNKTMKNVCAQLI